MLNYSIAMPLRWCGLALAASAMSYIVLACIAVRTRIRSSRFAAQDLPAVTILKPLCGVEPDTYECLRSFCDQAYAEFQVIFGVRDAQDPAVAVAKRLQKEFPDRDLQISIDRRRHGNSGKVSNLINMMPLARHEFLVLADSDVRVERDYLARIVGPLLDGGVGIVTCAYRGNPRHGIWSILGSLFINDWFMPSVRVAALIGSRSFAFGATIGIRREVLATLGGFDSVADQLADDYRLGELTRGLGLRTVLSDVVVETCVVDRSFGELVRHELRWLRTIRVLRPVSYGFCFVTCGVPVAILGACLAGGRPLAVDMLAITALARIALHFSTRKRGAPASDLALLPLRDILLFSLWIWSFVTRSVHWREDRYLVERDGSARLAR
ncbi:MAG: bacteriohopanetetrol glucosamine biosynthesis glycosyltransferase HpnI [Gammaproteobacteria bacterium]